MRTAAATRAAAPRAIATRDAAGFTLTEVVLILVIVGVALLPLSLLFANASIRSTDARDATVAAQLAQAKLEEIAADASSPARGYDYLARPNYPPEDPVIAFPRYRRSVTVSADSTFDGVRFRAVSVTVSAQTIPPVTLTTWFTSR